MNLPLVEVENVHTRFGRQAVHKGISLQIKRGEIVAIIGGSGAGKSVLLRCMIGLLQPAEGTVKLFGEDIGVLEEERLSEIRKRFAVLFQNGALFSALTVGENVAVPLKEKTDLAPEIISEIVALRLALSGLDLQTATKMPSELSGGMRKRAALARALALEPELLFLDEPTSGLDPINARAFDELIFALARAGGLTVIIITHDLLTVKSVADRVIVLGEGLILADGPPSVVANSDNAWIREYFRAGAENSI